MSTIILQFLKFVDSPKIQKFKYLENETFFFFQIKKSIPETSMTVIFQKIVF